MLSFVDAGGVLSPLIHNFEINHDSYKKLVDVETSTGGIRQAGRPTSHWAQPAGLETSNRELRLNNRLAQRWPDETCLVQINDAGGLPEYE